MPNFKAEKLRVNLRLCINRLKMLEKKKTEGAMKARREIADYIKNKRTERARIRVEHIIREDYMVEAMEVVELYCDLLLARFGMLEQMTYCEDSLAESVATLIWVAPRLSADIQELHQVSLQLEHKFGKPFAQQARSNMSGAVNPKVIHRLGAEAPKKSLVENYMIEIARNYKIEYEPDPTMFLEDDGMPTMDLDESPYVPDGSTAGSSAGPLPHKQQEPPPDSSSTRYQPFPPSSSGPPSQPPSGYGPPGPPPSGPPPSYPPPPVNPNLPYPTTVQGGVQPPPLPPDNLDLPPVPRTSFPTTGPGGNSGGSGAGGGSGDMDFDDLTRRFEELKKRK